MLFLLSSLKAGFVNIPDDVIRLITFFEVFSDLSKAFDNIESFFLFVSKMRKEDTDVFSNPQCREVSFDQL